MTILAEIFILLGTFLAFKGILGWWKSQNGSKNKPPPSLPSLPILGSLPFMRNFSNIAEFFRETAKQLGPIFTFQCGNRNFLVLNNKDVVQEAYVNNSSTFSGRDSIFTETFWNPNKKGLISLQTSPEWKRLHKLSLHILKDFGFGIKNLMETKIVTELEMMTKYLRKINGETFCPQEIISMAATNIVNNFVFGRRLDYEKGVGEIYQKFRKMFDSTDLAFDIAPIVRFLPKYRRKLICFQENMTEILTLIKRENEKCKQPEAEDCFVRSYIETEKCACNDEQLIYTVRDLIGAGSDTSISTLLWSLALLANHQEAQNRLRDEIDSVVPRDRLTNMNDIIRLPYTEATILEMMRFKTLAPLALPRVTLKDVEIKGYTILAGTTILANLYAVHMDRNVWLDPEHFRPERFLDEDNQVIMKDHVIPFSLGRRSCFGEVLARAEIFLIITGLVQNFVILPPEGQDRVDAKPLEPIGVTMIPLPIDLRLIPRM